MVDRAEKQQTPGALWPHRLVERMGGPAPVSISTWPRNAKSSKRSQSRRTRSSSLLLILKFNAGGVLLSHTLPGAVPSAQVGLASGFGKRPGVTPPQKPPTNRTAPSQQHPQGAWSAVSFQPLHNRREYSMLMDVHFVCASPTQPVVWFVTLRPISTSHLHTTQCCRIWPINTIISREPQKNPH